MSFKTMFWLQEIENSCREKARHKWDLVQFSNFLLQFSYSSILISWKSVHNLEIFPFLLIVLRLEFKLINRFNFFYSGFFSIESKWVFAGSCLLPFFPSKSSQCQYSWDLHRNAKSYVLGFVIWDDGPIDPSSISLNNFHLRITSACNRKDVMEWIDHNSPGFGNFEISSISNSTSNHLASSRNKVTKFQAEPKITTVHKMAWHHRLQVLCQSKLRVYVKIIHNVKLLSLCI
jgi:hypothetical protein